MSCTVGVDMGGTRIKIGLVENGKILHATGIDVHSALLEDHLIDLQDAIQSLLCHTPRPLQGIGIAFPSIVDSVNMKILSRYTKYTDAHEMDLSAWAKRNFGVPLILENDARAALIGEWQYGAGMNCNDLVLITLGTGVGSAVILDGKPLRGRHYFAGNLGGHMTINFDGNICNCGNIGCLESEASTWALARKFGTGSSLTGLKSFPPSKLDFEYIFASAKSGDALARGIRDECLKAWSLSVINLIHAYDPEKVVIGGGIMKSKDEILPFIREMVTKHSWCKNGDIKIVSAGQIEYAGILGMAYLVKALKNNR